MLLWIGIALVAICWPLNWLLPGARTAYLFFPLWLGYILTLDGLVQRRTGNSPWQRSRSQFIFLFVLSAAVWWLFEFINWRTRNWEYTGLESFTPVQRNLLFTVSFSVVMPAVFESAELVRSFRWVTRQGAGPRVPAGNRACLVYFVMGLAMFALMFAWPRYCYPFAWTSVVFVIEPLNRWLKRGGILRQLAQGDWRLFVSLAVGVLICGFFWEMWNYYSYPKWVYHTPGAEFLHVFEMPLLGYGGYVPFALELYGLQSLVVPGSRILTERKESGRSQ